jgi:hypothetical protein
MLSAAHETVRLIVREVEICTAALQVSGSVRAVALVENRSGSDAELREQRKTCG